MAVSFPSGLYELFAFIGQHLRPRKLYLLMQTNKQILASVEQDSYWTRVAAHLVWRGCESMEVEDYTYKDVHDQLPQPTFNMYHLNGADQGYCKAMDAFVARIGQMIALPAPEGQDLWRSFRGRSVREQTIMQYQATHDDFGMGPLWDEGTITMKQLAKRIVCSWPLSGNQKRRKAFVDDLEDHPMPARYKREIMQKLHTLLWEWEHASGSHHTCAAKIAQDICHF